MSTATLGGLLTIRPVVPLVVKERKIVGQGFAGLATKLLPTSVNFVVRPVGGTDVDCVLTSQES